MFETDLTDKPTTFDSTNSNSDLAYSISRLPQELVHHIDTTPLVETTMENNTNDITETLSETDFTNSLTDLAYPISRIPQGSAHQNDKASLVETTMENINLLQNKTYHEEIMQNIYNFQAQRLIFSDEVYSDSDAWRPSLLLQEMTKARNLKFSDLTPLETNYIREWRSRSCCSVYPSFKLYTPKNLYSFDNFPSRRNLETILEDGEENTLQRIPWRRRPQNIGYRYTVESFEPRDKSLRLISGSSMPPCAFALLYPEQDLEVLIADCLGNTDSIPYGIPFPADQLIHTQDELIIKQEPELPVSLAPRRVVRQSGEEPSEKASKQLKPSWELRDKPVDPRVKDLSREDYDRERASRQARKAHHDKFLLEAHDEVVAQAAALTIDPVHQQRKHASKKAAEIARKEYAARHPAEPPAKVKGNISKYMNCSELQELSSRERFYLFNKTHKCKHRRRFNVFKPVFNDVVTGPYKEKVLSYFIPDCDHEKEHLGQLTDDVCGNCGRTTMATVTRNGCECDVKCCVFCKFTSYNHAPTESWAEVCLCNEYKCYEPQEEKELSMEDFVNTYAVTKKKNAWKRDIFSEFKTRKTISPTEYPPLGSEEPEKPKTSTPFQPIRKVEKQGGGSSKPEAPGTETGIYTSIKQSLMKIKKSVVDYYKTMTVRSVIGDCVIGLIDGIAYVLDLVKTRPFECALLALTLYDIKNGADIDWKRLGLTLVITLKNLGIFNEFAKIIKLKTVFMNNECTILQWFYNTIGIEYRVLGDEEPAAPSVYSIAYGRVKDFFATKVEKQAGITDYCKDLYFRFYAFMCKIFGFVTSSRGFSRLSGFAKEFNAIFTLGKGIMALSIGLIAFMPRFIQSFFISMTADKYIEDSLTKKSGTPYELLTECAITRVLALTENRDCITVETQRTKADGLLGKLLAELQAERLSPTKKSEEFVTRCRKLNGELSQAEGRSREPFCIFVTGKAGVGKSTYAPALLAPLFPGKTIKEIRELIYTRNPGTESWAGYDPAVHKVILYDDFAQHREETDFIELINIVSVADLVLDMPAIDPALGKIVGLKGTKLVAPIVMCLSNMAEFNPTTLISPDAIVRRLNNCALSTNERGVFQTMDMKHEVTTSGPSKQKCIRVKPTTLGGCMSLQETQQYILHRFNEKNKRLDAMEVDLEAFAWKEGLHEEVDSSDSEDEEISFGTVGNRTYAKVLKESGELVTHGTYLYQSVLAAGFSCSCVSWMISCFTEGWRHFFAKEGSWKPVVLAIAGLACTVTTYLTLSGYFNKHPELESGTTNTVIPRKTVKPQSDNGVVNVIRKNLIHIRISMGERRAWTNGIFIGGLDFMTVEHVFMQHDGTYIPDGTDVEIFEMSVRSTSIKFKFDHTRLVRLVGKEDKDIAIYRLPACSTHPRANIVNHFTNSAKSKKTDRIIFFQYDRNTHDLSRTNSSITDVNVAIEYEVNREGREVSVMFSDTIYYDVETGYGDCGGPVILDAHGQPTVVALHVAGDPDRHEGVGMLFSKNMVEQALQKLERFETVGVAVPVIPECAELILTKEDVDKVGLEGTLYLQGKAADYVHSPSRTTIKPSPLYDMISQHTTEPAILSAKDPRMTEFSGDILLRGVNKWSITPHPFPNDLLDLVCDSIAEEICAQPSKAEKRILSMSEAINGVHGMNYVDCLNMKSSPGTPFVFNNALKGEKRKLFSHDGKEYSIASPLLAELFAERKRNAERGLRTLGRPWVDTLKDERRPIEKVKTGKTRVFTVAPLDYILLSRMYNLMFAAHFYSIRIRTFSAVGINRGSLEWHKLVKHLLEVGDQGFDGDFEKFDGTLMAEVVQRFIVALDKWYGDKSVVRRVLLHEISFCPHQFRNILLYTNGGMCSGTDLTVIINSWVAESYLRLVWMTVMPLQYRDIYHYRRFVRTAIYGDDNWVAVERSVIPYFNQQTVAAVLAEHGMGYTPAHKNAELTTTVPVTSCMFLKNNTGKLRNFYVAQFEESANLETLSWVRVSDDDDLACEDNCNSVLRNAFFYGKDYFTELRNKILYFKPSYNLVNFDPLYVEFFTDGYVNSDSNDFGFTKNSPPLSMRRTDSGFVSVFPFNEELDEPTITMHVVKQSFFSNLGKEADNLVSSLIPGNIVGDALGLLLDKPIDPISGVPATRKDQQYMSNARNIESLENLTLDPAAMQSCDAEHFATRVPETKLSTLFRIPTFLGQFTWKTDDPVGTTIYKVDLGPMIDFDDGPNYFVPQDLCLLSYLSNQFQMWRGGIRIIIQVISSSFHEGKLAIKYHPAVNSVLTDPNASASQYMTVYSLRNTGNEFQVLCPFESDVPWKYVWRGQKTADTRADNVYKYTDYFLGKLTVDVDAPLKTTQNVVPSVQINVFIAGADDYEVNGLSFYGMGIIPVELTKAPGMEEFTPRKVTKQSGTEETTSGQGQEQSLDQTDPVVEIKNGVGLATQVDPVAIEQTLAPPYTVGSRATAHLGELPWDLADMLSRFNLIGTYEWNTSQVADTEIFKGDVIADLLNNPNASVPFTRFYGFRCDYVKIRAEITGSRYQQGQLIMAFIPSQRSKDYYTQYYSFHRLSSVQCCYMIASGSTSVEFVIPFTFYKGWIDLLNDDTLGQLHVKVYNQLLAATGTTTTATLKLFVSFVGSQFKIPRQGVLTWKTAKQIMLSENELRALPTTRRKVDRQSGEEGSTAPKSKVNVIKKKVPFSMNDSTKYGEDTAIIMAPSRAKTYDPKCRHFGERYDELNEICKRYVPLPTTIFDMPRWDLTKNRYFIVNVPFEGLCPESVDQTAMMRLATMYRNFRGALNFKVKCTIFSEDGTANADLEEQGYVSFIGGDFNTTNLQWLSTCFAGDTTGLMATPIPRAYFSVNQTAEFQVPWMSQTSTRLIGHTGDNDPTYDNIFDDNFNLILALPKHPTSAMKVYVEIHYAFADATRMGVFLGQPMIVGQAVDHNAEAGGTPDYWTVLPPA